MTPRIAFALGFRAVLPILVGVAPFGVIYGVVALQSGIPALAAMAMSSIVFAGSAQFLLTDEAYAAAIPHLMAARPGSPQAVNAHWILFGSGLGLWSGWQLATLAGVLIGAQLPSDLGLDFALPLTFIAIVVPMLQSRGLLLAALTAGAVAVALVALPYKTGLFIAALAGLVAGAAMPRERN